MAIDSSGSSGRPDLSLSSLSLMGQDFFPSILNTLEEPFFLLDSAFKFFWHNKACNDLYHSVSAMDIGKNFDFNVLLTTEQQDLFRQHLEKVAAGEKVHFDWRYELTVIKWVSVSLYPFRSPNGAFAGVCGSLRDITEKKLIKYQTLVDPLNEGVILQTLDKQVLAVNQSAIAILGLTPEKLKATAFPPPNAVLVDEHENEIGPEEFLYKRNGQLHGIRNKVIGIRHAGRIQWLNVNTAIVTNARQKDPYTLLISFDDITRQKNISSEMEVLSLLARETVNAVIILHPEGELLWMNEGFARLTGYSAEELIGKSSRAFLMGPDTDMNTVNRAAHCRRNGLPFLEEFQIYTKGGKKIWTRVQGQSIRQSKGNVPNYFLIITDITEEKKIQQELEVLSLVAKETNNGVIIFNKLSGNTLWVNEGFTRLTGYTAADILGKNSAQTLQGPDTDRDQLRSWADRIEHNLSYTGDFILYTKDGTKKIHHVTGQPFKNENGDVTRYFAVSYDVTDQRRMEEERLQYEVGQQKKITRIVLKTRELERNLLGRELHDNINQILAATRLQLSYCVENFSICKPVLGQCLDNLTLAMEETRRLSHRMVMPRFTERSLPQALKNLIEPYQHTRSIQLDTTGWDDDKVSVAAKEAFFRIAQEQLSNIYKHAKATQVTLRIACEGKIATLTVQDNGVGFDPCGKKDGLGLSNIRSRAECCEGTAQFISAPDKGCTLLVNIPLI